MVALGNLIRPWNDFAAVPAPQDGTTIEAEDSDGERVVVEWQNDTWVMGRTEEGGWITLIKDIVRWRHL